MQTITTYNLNISATTSKNWLLTQLNQINNIGNDIKLHFTINNGFIQNDCYLILVSFFNQLKANGKNIEIEFEGSNCNTHNYASRINFFTHLDVSFIEQFKRHNTSKSLIPITHIKEEVYGIPEGILNIFSNNFKMSDEDVYDFSFIIHEMICNTTIHSKSSSGAYMFMQRYQAKKELEFILIDSGIGIKESLSKNENYQHISNAESLKLALNYEVTCGEGRGHGLYFVSEFVKRNNYELELISGNNTAKIKNGTLELSQNPHWQGVILKIIFKFDSEISIQDILGEKYV